MFKVIINGEAHVMRNQFLNIQVDEDKPLDVKVKYNWDGSSVYTFHSKDNILLRISVNKRMMNWVWALLLAAMILTFVIGYFYENGRFILLIPWVMLAFLTIYYTIRRKKYFVIQEVI